MYQKFTYGRYFNMDKIIGTNLGNWLVLEKWMQPFIFKGTGAEDETWLNRNVPQEKLWPMMKEHRDTYVTEEDFQNIASHGLNTVRIPVPYFIFGDREPYSGCIEYLDKAFDWAGKYGLKVLVDLHTAPGGQNSYDNGGIEGVCKWSQQPDEVEFVLTVLERLAMRYRDREELFGIEVLNEPISFSVYMTALSRKKAADKAEAKGSRHVSSRFLKKFYVQAYGRLRKILPEEKVIVFHDGFRLGMWKDFFVKHHMKNVMIDTHIYIQAMEDVTHIHSFWAYRAFIAYQQHLLKKAQKYTPVFVGEWCVCNELADKKKGHEVIRDEYEDYRKKWYRKAAVLQLNAWKDTAGFFYWNYQLYRDKEVPMYATRLDSWDLCRCWKKGWMPVRTDRFMEKL